MPCRFSLIGFHILLLALVMMGSTQGASAQTPTVAQATVGIERQAGFIPFYWDASAGKVMMEITDFGTDVLYYVSAASGGGSVEMPLDRGILDSAVIHFVRAGPRVMVVEQNLDFRAVGGSVERARNVDDSFPDAVLAALPLVAEGDGVVLVDATPLFMRDAGAVETSLRRLNQGVFRLDPQRSGFHPPRMKAFPDNTEIETLMTYSIENAGTVVNNVVADSRTMSVRIHHSFLRAPEGYTPRVADPRIGVSSLSFRNYANDFDQGTEVSWVTRWRLEKQNPEATLSPPIKPVVFYLDPAIPEPVREAMRAGTLWWNEAFEAAGFRNAVEVREPTPDMDPMDIRYAWVLWIERDERGFSSGGTYRDPRTGEILGSKTRMDSHRIRTIANYWESYQAALIDHNTDMPSDQRDMVLLRQSLLIAHELGHVLGFQHNFSSSLNDRASVMEYPTPRVKVTDGKLDLSESFAEGIGAYDIFMVRYAYTPFASAEEQLGLDRIISEMRSDGILFVPESDPRWSWYDDRATPMEYLRETSAAREIMLSYYGPDLLQPGEPIGALRDMRLWMAYLHHRWAIEAGQRYIGGMFHEFAVRGEAIQPTQIVPGTIQREVLTLLMQTIAPEQLFLPESLLVHLTPHPGTNLEDLSDDYAFDQLRAARILTAMVVEPLLEPAKAARMVSLADRDPETLTLPELIEALLAQTWRAAPDPEPRLASLRRVTQSVVLQSLMALAVHDETTPEVRAFVMDQLHTLDLEAAAGASTDPMAAAFYRQSARDLESFLDDPLEYEPAAIMPAWGGRPRSRYPLPPGPPL